MRVKYLFSLGLLAGLSAASGLAGCTEKADVAPEAPCGTTATVRLCLGNTLMCPTEHTTLVLADGTRLRPRGPLWEAYLPQQANGATLRIGYTRGATLPAGDIADVEATITCLEYPVMRCGTPSPGGW
ncbi:hypothetical protein [Hymenobacter armeniacus]|uniref:hypothetical protein n=1 Tax=Hymenobacter armeniacus TaxID=2771358 RepID=UPI001CC25563|nr:hypothetical protein [Hymenobacter armeniacus]